ncbi:MAG: sugar phosphate isomerase/epimerase family protein [Bacteroidota bacterium]
MNHPRRTFLGSLASLVALGWLSEAEALAGTPATNRLPIASNQYSWITFYQRQGHDWFTNLDASLAEFAKSGIVGYEPLVNTPEELQALAPLIKKHGLEMHSLYVNSTLHKAEEADKSLKQVLAIAKVAQALGITIMVTNPSPVRWGGSEDKTDAELDEQAKNLNTLGAGLRQHGITLAYHNHDPEMRQSAREFHHMMLSTEPKNVSFCLDAHWVYRGAGNSQIALFDIVQLYGKRIAEVHLRQSKNGIWKEVFEEGDIDYARLANELLKLKIRPNLVLEQCVETESSNTLDALAAHQQSLRYASRVFSAFTNK